MRFLSSLITTGVHAKPKVKETVKHYTISGDSVDALKKQMKRKGPNGFWSYTE